MNEPTSATTILVSGVSLLGAGLAYASAVASDIPIPEPTTIGMMELLQLTLIGWVVKEVRSGSKKEQPDGVSGEHQTGWRQLVLAKAEEAVLGTKDIAQALQEHREEYIKHSTLTGSRLDTIEGQIRIMNKHNSGEIPRPKEIKV